MIDPTSRISSGLMACRLFLVSNSTSISHHDRDPRSWFSLQRESNVVPTMKRKTYPVTLFAYVCRNPINDVKGSCEESFQLFPAHLNASSAIDNDELLSWNIWCFRMSSSFHYIFFFQTNNSKFYEIDKEFSNTW